MKKTILFILIILLCFLSSTYSMATTLNPDDYAPKPITEQDAQAITERTGIIVGVIRIVGIIVLVLVLIVLGIKYMIGTIEERAEYKKSMLPYIVGVFIFFGVSQLLSIIIDFVAGFE